VRRIVAIFGLVALASAGADAHHSWSADYDLAQSKRLVGTIARVQFQNPHSAIMLDVETPDERVERWRLEWGSPQRLRERGVREGTLKAGDRLTVTGNPHRQDGEKSLRVESLRRMSDGLEL
jgi:Family of unknown function (DUF6152)